MNQPSPTPTKMGGNELARQLQRVTYAWSEPVCFSSFGGSSRQARAQRVRRRVPLLRRSISSLAKSAMCHSRIVVLRRGLRHRPPQPPNPGLPTLATLVEVARNIVFGPSPQSSHGATAVNNTKKSLKINGFIWMRQCVRPNRQRTRVRESALWPPKTRPRLSLQPPPRVR